MHLISAKNKTSSYPVYIGYNILQNIKLFKDNLKNSRLIIVIDNIVSDLYLTAILNLFVAYSIDVITIGVGEEHKTWDSVSKIIEILTQKKHDRFSTLISFGGGVVGDLAGFAASIFMRGISWIQVPTTLLAQVDAAIGGKTGCNYLGVKNLIGTFYKPRAVVIDVALLKTLAEREYLSGLAEIVKYGMACDGEFFVWLEINSYKLKNRDTQVLQQVIHRCCKIKLAVVELDEKDEGLRRTLNFGHTFAHALEAATKFQRYLHGEAVAIGMLLATRLAVKLGLVGPELLERLRKLLGSLGLAFELEHVACTADVLFNYMTNDKKNHAEQLCLILPCALGEVRVIQGFKLEILEDLIEDYASN